MYINNEERKAKIGRVSLSVRNGSIKIRFTYPTNTKEDLTVDKDSDVVWRRWRETGSRAVIIFDLMSDSSPVKTGKIDRNPYAAISIV